MKKLSILIVLLAAVLLLPMTVFAEGEEVTSEEVTSEEVTDEGNSSTEVPVYFFRGEGCPHCEEAETWFKSIEEEYGSKFKIVDYETWYDEDNADLMQKVAKARGEKAEGVPYIIIGNKSWNGFDESSYAEEIISEIETVYAQAPADRYDIMQYINTGSTGAKDKDKSNSDVLALILIILVCGGIGFGVYKARATAK